MKFPIKDFSSKCYQICSFLRIWSHLPEKSLTENFIVCAVWLGRWIINASVPVPKILGGSKVSSACHSSEVDFIFNCHLAAPRPVLGYYRGDSLIHPLHFYNFDPKITGNLVTSTNKSSIRNSVPETLGELVVRGKMSPRSGSAALIELNHIH